MEQNTKTSILLYPWFCWGMAGLLELIHIGLLVFPSSIPEQLQQSLQIGPKDLSIFFSSYLYMYVLMQIPAGLIYDRFKVQWVLTIPAVCLAIGCIIIALSDNYFIALAARIFMGFGASFIFLGAVYLGRLWFSAIMFPVIVGLTETMACIGSISSVSLFSWMTQLVSYQYILLGIAAFLLAVAPIIFFFIQEPSGSIKKQDRNISIKPMSILRNPQVWLLGFYVGFLFAHIIVMQNMWGISLLRNTYKISTTLAIFENSLVMIGYLCGALSIGYFSRFFSERQLLLYCGLIQFISLSILFFVHPNLIIHGILVFTGGFVTGALVLCFDIVKKLVPVQAHGIGSGFLAMFVTGFGIIVTTLVGYLLKITNNFHLSTIPVILCSFATIILAIALCRYNADHISKA